jgi:hypothetical protein
MTSQEMLAVMAADSAEEDSDSQEEGN